MSAVKPKIPNFNIVELCGRGGSSEVWLGIDDDGIKRAIRIMDKVNEGNAHRIELESKAIALYRNVANQHVNLLEIQNFEKPLLCHGTGRQCGSVRQ